MSPKLKSILTIAGSDPCGGAGIQADVMAGNSLGVHVLTAITAITAQNSKGMKNFNILPPSILSQQLTSIIEDCRPDAIKIGMIGSLENLMVIIHFIKDFFQGIPVVVDPVLKISADNYAVTEEGMVKEIINSLFDLATVITPNIPELIFLLGKENISKKDFDIKSTEILQIPHLLNCSNVIIKGGHGNSDHIEDILINGERISYFRHKKISCKNLHGTGCVFSTLLASFLSLDFDLESAFFKTVERMEEIICRSRGYELGDSEYGPLNINTYSI